MTCNNIDKLNLGTLPHEISSVYDIDEHSLNELIYHLLARQNDFIGLLENKTDLYGDHKGSWQGLNKPTLTEEGAAAQVEKNMADIETIFNLLNEFIFVMPSPTNVLNDTLILQEVLDKAKEGKKHITIYFPGDYYYLNEITLYSNTNFILSSKTVLHHIRKNVGTFISTVKVMDSEEQNINNYNAAKNIKIYGGTIKAECSITLVHSTNIEISNVTFIEADSDHYVQIGACKNVTIKGCTFKGMRTPSPDRQYVEYIQIDYMTHLSLPYWESTAPIYDHSVNDGIYILNNRFMKSLGNYDNLCCAMGSHSSDEGRLNKNIYFENNVIDYFSYSIVSGSYMDGLYIRNNKCLSALNTSLSINAFRGVNCKNVFIDNNTLYNGSRAIFIVTSENININNIDIFNHYNTSDYFMISESNNITINNISFNNCSGGNYAMLIRNCINTIVDNIKDIGCINNENYLIAVYSKNNLISDKIKLTNINTKLGTANITNTTNVIGREETLYSGSTLIEEIKLNESLNNFENIKIVISWYGYRTLNFDLTSNYMIHTCVNVPDSGTNNNLEFMEIKIVKIDDLTINIEHSTVIGLTNGVHEIKPSTAFIMRLTGTRKTFSS